MQAHVAQVFGRQVVSHVDRARFERDQALALARNQVEDQMPDLGGPAIPVVGIGGQRDAIARHPLDKAEGAGPDRVARELVLPVPDRPRRHDRDREHGQVGQEGRVRALDQDAHGVVVELLDALDDAVVGVPVREIGLVVGMLVIALAIEREHDRIGVERCAVVEAHAATQMERPRFALVGHLPGGGERGLDLVGAGLVAHQVLEDLLAYLRRVTVVDARRIEQDGVAAPAHRQRGGVDRDVAAAGESEERAEKQATHARKCSRSGAWRDSFLVGEVETRWARWWPLFALLGTLAAGYAPVLFLGRTFALRDHLMFVRPLLVHLGRELRAGRLPEWWDGIGLGLPHLANPAHGVCYPPLWLLALLPESWGGDALLLAHFFLLGAGGLLFARQLGADRLGGAFAGAALMTSGYVASVVTSGSLFTLAWTPWVAWAADRAAAGAAQGGRAWQRAGALLAGLIAIQVLSGDPAGVLSSLLVATGVVLARAPRRGRAVLTLAAAVVAAAALAAVLLLPALLWARESERARGLPLAAASMWSLHPLRALEWVWPHALGDPIDPARNLARLVARAGPSEREPGFAYSLYLGAPALLLALVVAVRGRACARGLLAGAAVLTVLAFGRYTPLYAAYRWLVLPERLLRYPEKHFAGAVVIVCALAGLGLREAFAQPPSRRLLLAASGLGAALLAGAAALALAPAAPLARLSARAAALAPPLDVSAALAVARAGALRAAAVVALLVGALVLARGDTRARAAAALTAAAAVLDLLVHGWSLQVLIARADCVRPPALLQPVLAAARPGAPRPRLYRLHTMA